MRVGTRLAAGFLALTLLFGVLLFAYHGVVERSVDTASRLADVDTNLLLGAAGQLELIETLEEDAAKFRITGDMGYFERYLAGRDAISDTLARLRRLSGEGGPRSAVTDLSEAWAEFGRRFATAGADPAAARAFYQLSAAEWAAHGQSLADIDRLTRELRLASIASVTESVGSLARGAERVRVAGWLALAVALVLGGVLAGLIVRSITAPLRRIERGTAALARGDFSSRVEVSGRNELAALAARFNEMADRLGELDLAKRDFLARVSHDLKTPLASIRETQRVLLDGAPGELNPKQRRLTELGLANAERLSDMISRILELSRLEAGVEEYDFETVDLAEICADTVERFAFEARGSRVSLAGASDSAPVHGDRDALQRVLENLLDNARSHGGEGGVEVELTVAPAKEGERVVVQVRDHGPGVDEDDAEAIFQSFSHARNGAVGKGHVGLGLAICREIVAAHGGEIWVENARDGGSIFGFSLPITGAPRASEPPRPAEDAAEGRAVRRTAITVGTVVCAAFWGCSSGARAPEIDLPPPSRAPAVEPAPPIPAPGNLVAPHPFDLLFEAGEWEEAAAVFASDSTLHRRERALFRSGLIHATPGSAAFDPDLARARFGELIERFPASERRTVASVVLQLVSEVDRSTDALAALAQQLERLKAVDLDDPPPE